MKTPQSAILPEAMQACIVIEADVCTDHFEAFKTACRTLQAHLHQHQQQYPQAQLGMSVAFGAKLWAQLRHNPQEGAEIKPFVPLGNGLAPATQHDMLIHIQSLHHAANLPLALQLLAELKDFICVAQETHGFRLREDRGLDGFVDGTENPKAEARLPIGVDENGGSYVLIQRYQHDLSQWNALSDARQSSIVGRSKAEDEELSAEQRLPDSHLGRVDLKENGQGLKIIRQSLPYGTASGEHGLLFIAYCARLYNIEQQLLSMFGERDGKTDLLLSHISKAISGSYYYAPSVERLMQL